jgi:PAS domain-containing protein
MALAIALNIFLLFNFNLKKVDFFSWPMVLFHVGLVVGLGGIGTLLFLHFKRRNHQHLLKDFQNLFHHFSNPVLVLDKEQQIVLLYNRAALKWLEVVEEKSMTFSELHLGALKQETITIHHPNKGIQQLTKQVYPLELDGQNMILVVLDIQAVSKKLKPTISMPIQGIPNAETLWVRLTFTGEILETSVRFSNLIRNTVPSSFLSLLRPSEKKKFTEILQNFLKESATDNNLITRIHGKNGMVDIAWELQWSNTETDPTLTLVGIDLTKDLTEWRNEKMKWEHHEAFWCKVPMNAWTVDFHSFRMLYGTQGAKSLFGSSLQTFQQDPNHWLNLVLPEDRIKVYDTLQALEKNNEAHYRYRILTTEGQQKTIESHQFIERGEDGKPIKIHGVSFEAPLHEQERILQFEYLDALLLPLMVVGKSGKILYANKELSQYLQIPTAELIDQHITHYMPDEQWISIENHLRSQTPISLLKEIHWTTLEGPSETQIHPFQHGILLHLNKEKVRLHRHQPDKAALQMFRRIISYSPDLIWSINLNLEIQVANQPFLEATQLNQGTVHEGLYLHGLVQDHSAMKWWLERLNQVFDGAIIREEFDLKTMGWKGDVAEFLLFPIHDADQRISGAGCIARNISHFKHLELGLRDRNQALENLIYHTSHHLRAPLANALGLISLLQETPAKSQEEEAKEKLNESLLKLDQIIRSSIQQTRNILTEKDQDF